MPPRLSTRAGACTPRRPRLAGLREKNRIGRVERKSGRDGGTHGADQPAQEVFVVFSPLLWFLLGAFSLFGLELAIVGRHG